jgi:hypothetical protein
MGASILAEQRASFAEQIEQHIHGNCQASFEPTQEYPGSPGKIEVLRKRVQLSKRFRRQLPLCQPNDAQMPLTKGWRFGTRNNGRVPMVDRTLSDDDQALAREEILRQDAQSVRDEIARQMRVEGFAAWRGQVS